MTFLSHDPRKTIRSTIGTLAYTDDDQTYYYLSVSDDVGDTIKIPIYMHEEVKSGVLPELPYIDVRLMRVGYVPQNIGASVYKHDAVMDFVVMFADMDNIDRTSLGKRIVDELISKIRTYQSITSGSLFLTVNAVRMIESSYGHQVVYVYIVEVSSLWEDAF